MEDLAPGFRFYPTEEELVSFYLHNKLQGNRSDDLNQAMDRVIPVLNIYELNPWDLPQSSGDFCNGESEEWFFFNPRQECEARGGRPKRLTSSGYWKSTGSPGYVYSSSNNRCIGFKRTMVFYMGRIPNGRKTEWKMNEYKAIQPQQSSSTAANPMVIRQEFSLCRVYKTSKCRRAFDRRPVSVMEIGITSHHQNHPLIEVSSQESHGGVPSQIWDSNMTMAIDNEPLWDWDFYNLDDQICLL